MDIPPKQEKNKKQKKPKEGRKGSRVHPERQRYDDAIRNRNKVEKK